MTSVPASAITGIGAAVPAGVLTNADLERTLDTSDDWIVERIGKRDIAVTADIPLAARCLKRGAQATGPTGKPLVP